MTINISKCFGDIIDHESEAPMGCDITRNPSCIYSCLHTSLFCVLWDTLIQIEMKMIESFKNMKKRNVPFLSLSPSSLNVLFFPHSILCLLSSTLAPFFYI